MKRFKLKAGYIKEVLSKRDLSERDLAKLIGTSQALVNYWLNSESVSGAVRIADALKLNAKDLIK